MKKTHPKDRASGSGTIPGTRSAAAAARAAGTIPLKPTYKPAAKRKRKSKASELNASQPTPNASQPPASQALVSQPTPSQPLASQAPASQAPASHPTPSQAHASQPTPHQQSQGSTRGRKRGRSGLGTQ